MMQSSSQICQTLEGIARVIHQSNPLPQHSTIMLNSQLCGWECLCPPFEGHAQSVHLDQSLQQTFHGPGIKVHFKELKGCMVI